MRFRRKGISRIWAGLLGSGGKHQMGIQIRVTGNTDQTLKAERHPTQENVLAALAAWNGKRVTNAQ